jgi:hypothetical protein
MLTIPLAVMFHKIMTGSSSVAHARGLVQFPCNNGLSNSYHFLRVGTTMLEEEGEIKKVRQMLLFISLL